MSHPQPLPGLSAAPSCFLGIDVGGTKTAGGVITFPGHEVIYRRTISTLPNRGGRPVLDNIVSLATELKTQSERAGLKAEALGLGLCELVDTEGRPVSENLIHWMHLPVQKELSAIAPTIIDADVRVAALAEALFGAGKGYRSFIYFTVGTGISSCLVLDGKAYMGAHGVTGTMASSSISVPCDACGTVMTKTLEDVASGLGLVARYNAYFAADPGAKLAKSAQEVISAAQKGNAHATWVVDTALTALASQIGLIINTLDPEAIVIGGGLGLSEGPFREKLFPLIRQHIWSEPHRDIPMLYAASGADTGWMGAAARAHGWHQHKIHTMGR